MLPDRVGVLGAGIQGSCIALALADRGWTVDLYDRAEEPITQASLYNEGKIHLGFVYGRDGGGATTETMARGSLRFFSLLRRWLGTTAEALAPSAGFVYAIHRDTMSSTDDIDSHFARVQRAYDDMMADPRLDYLGERPKRLTAPLSTRETARLFDDSLVVAAYRTVERSIAPWRVATLVRAAIAAHPRITFIGKTCVRGASLDGVRDVRVALSSGGRPIHVKYPYVVNALWAGRLGIDRAVGIAPHRPWLYRSKLAILVTLSRQVREIPSTTFVLGPFGDIVNFAGARLYLSWYPRCMIGVSSAITPPDVISGLDEATTEAIRRDSVVALTALCPSLRKATDAILSTEIGGGAICAWGSTDIDDPQSGLHRRHDVGVKSYGRYHSVDTGKYCLAPLFAVEVANRITA